MGFLEGVTRAAEAMLDNDTDNVEQEFMDNIKAAKLLQAAVSFDDKEEEQAAQDEELRRGEVTGNEAADEDNTFGAGYAASLKATHDYWNRVKSRKPSATYERVRGRSGKPVAIDHVANNANKAKSFSMFDSAKSIIKRQRKSA